MTPLEKFYAAEDYHQDYATLHPDSPYIFYNDLPKVENLQRLFPEIYRDDPVLVSEASKPSLKPRACDRTGRRFPIRNCLSNRTEEAVE